MIKQTIYTNLTKFIAWLRRGQIIKPNVSPVKINLGSGLAVYGDWINVDVNMNILFARMPVFFLKLLYKYSGAKNWYSEDEFLSKLRNHTFVHHRLEYGFPFESNSVDYVYSSHTLEHLFKEDAKNFIKEAYRVLKKGGLIRICVPDLEHALSLYNEGKKEQGLSYFFPQSSSDYLSRHQYMYDFELLKSLLESEGFHQVTKCSYRNGETPDIDKLDTRPEETLFVEARK